jgi:hypothetical protein
MSASEINRDISAESYARHIGTAILYVNTEGEWSVGQKGQKVSEYQKVKYGTTTSINDDTYEFTALTVEAREGGGYVMYLQSNADLGLFVEAYIDGAGNVTGVKTLSQAEMFAAEVKWGVDLNDNGGLGDAMVLVDAGSVNLYIDGGGAYQIKQADGKFAPLTYLGQAVSLVSLKGYEIESVVAQGGGYKIFVRDSQDNIIEVGADEGGTVSTSSIKTLGSTQLAAAEAETGQDLDGKGDLEVTIGWTTTLKNSAIQAEVASQTANDAKITHAGLVKIVDAAIKSLSSASVVGESVFSDLQAIAARGKELFTSKDLTGTETGYLQYVFEKMVNGSKANNFYTDGGTQIQALGNLSADAATSVLQKLENKWLLGKDHPNPNTEGDTANPNATAASGVYKAFDAPLIAGNTAAFDVSQGNAGTCYLLAAIASIAQVNPTVFNTLFAENGAGSNGSSTWGVRFFDTGGKENWVTVDNQLVVRSAEDTTSAYTKVQGVDAAGNTTPEMWAPLVEKAYAQANELQIFGRQKQINAMFAIEGGFAEGLVNVAGGKVTQYGPEATIVNGNPILQISTVPEGSTALAEYTKALNTGKSVFVVSFTNSKDANGATLFTSGHAYMAYDADPASATNTSCKVYNPWGPTTANHIAPFDADLVTLIGTEGISFWVGV